MASAAHLGMAGTVMFYAVAGGVAALLGWVTLTGRECWPFSHYPMFAGRLAAPGVRFFRMRLYFAAGTTTGLGGAAEPLVDELHRAIERVWECGPEQTERTGEIVRRCWREACRLDPTLAAAVRADLMLHVARIQAAGRIEVTGQCVQSLSLKPE